MVINIGDKKWQKKVCCTNFRDDWNIPRGNPKSHGKKAFLTSVRGLMKRGMSATDESSSSESSAKASRVPLKIGTHDGGFHVDEALACFMLRHYTAAFAGAEVVRTRDPAVLATLPILCDVGAVYDPATHRYDHHQRSFTETWDSKHDIRLSSAGLVRGSLFSVWGGAS